MRTRILVFTLASLVAACSGDVSAPRLTLRASSTLHYDAFTDQLRPLLSGTLDLVVHEDSTITGSWTIAWVPGADTTTRVGDQVGSGALTGRLWSDTVVVLDLNPGYADNNVTLGGACTVNGLAGTWTWSGIAGPMTHGRFTARYDF